MMERELEEYGYVKVPAAVDQERRERLLRLLDLNRLQRVTRHRSGEVFAARHLLAWVPELALELGGAGVDELAARLLGPGAFPVDATYFDKQRRANWTVPAHQDRVLPVVPVTGQKHRLVGGVAVAEPSEATLASLLALRLHFDATDGDKGGLRVLPGSHRGGIMSAEQVRAAPLSSFVACAVEPGDVFAMRPLLLHRSSPSKGDGQRRVLHVVYAPLA